MKFFILVFLLFSQLALAVNPSEDWTIFCGDKKTLMDHFGAGEVPTAQELEEINQSRLPILKILTGGKKAIAELLEEGSRSDTGAFGVIIACGVIENIKLEIKEKGCFSLTTNKPVKDKGGIKACEEVLSKLPRS